MKLESYKVLDDYLVVNNSFYYELSSLKGIRLDDNYLKLDKESWVGEWFNLVDFDGDISELITFIESTNKLIKDAKSKDYLVVEWGIFFFIMLALSVVSCFIGMIIGVSCGIHV
jgi:hypothetical protein